MVRVMRTAAAAPVVFDLAKQSVRELNQYLHGDLKGVAAVRVENPDGAHSLGVAVNAPVRIEIDGNVGYYAAGMNQQATVIIDGNAEHRDAWYEMGYCFLRLHRPKTLHMASG